jgi:putative transposase
VSGSIPTIIRAFKSAVTYHAGKELHTANLWQSNYYEHIIRDSQDYERIAFYITQNPLNWFEDEENLDISDY